MKKQQKNGMVIKALNKLINPVSYKMTFKSQCKLASKWLSEYGDVDFVVRVLSGIPLDYLRKIKLDCTIGYIESVLKDKFEEEDGISPDMEKVVEGIGNE